MKIGPAAVALCAFLVPTPSPAAEPGPAAVGQWATAVCDPDTLWDERADAEEALATLPPGRVLPALVAKMPDRPDGPAHPPAASADADKDGPAPWLAYYSAQRVWAAQLDGVPADDPAMARLLLDLLPQAATPAARQAVAAALGAHGSAAAEAPLARLFRDAAEPPAVRAAAAGALLARRRGGYYNEIRGVAAADGGAVREAVFGALVADATRRGEREIDPVVAAIGVELMERKCRSTGDDQAGFDAAILLGKYLGRFFRPEESAAKYGGWRGEEAFRRDTVAAARAWGAIHGKTLRPAGGLAL